MLTASETSRTGAQEISPEITDGDDNPTASTSLEGSGRPRRTRRVGPIVRLRATGDGTVLARALTRVLVRRALNVEATTAAPEDCEISSDSA
jgi:hypothetical protein